jgi:valyl-tRNA synthetase
MDISDKTAPGTDMPPQYDPRGTEEKWYAAWLERGLFHSEPNPGRDPYCIVLPPPNVTGALHAGHAFQQSLQDFIIRRARMQGFEALWLPGTDHAGIATQVVVERELAREGLDRREMGREAFLERVWEWKDTYGGRIVEQMQALGNSCDWDRLRFTMDEGLSRAVRVAFVRMYDDGLIYRGERIINWCPRDRTALSDSEVEHEEVDGELVTFRYELSGGGGHLDVATTRVETMLGDTGVAVHPTDERYAALVGRTVRHPFDGRDLPIVADAAVDPSFGTGAVKVTPAHDPNDFEIAERTGLPRLNILNADATVADTAPEEFRGLDRYEARKRVTERLRELGLIVAEERPYRHSVGHCYRCHSEIEPWLSGKQWFVAVDRLRTPAIEAAEDGRIRFHPDRWKNAYLEWLRGLRDWNISRQLWWGHRIPVWYCPNGHEFAAVEDPTECPECGSVGLEQDPDVLDTWFSSQLWPFSTLGWPDRTPELDYYYPTTILVTGYEILYLWVARMIMSGMYLVGDVPFHNVLIHGLVRDAQGRKMSKSLGNVIDPLDMIEEYGADALRFALARMGGPEQQNLPLSTESIEAARNFANKIWNGARQVFAGYGPGDDAGPRLPPPEDWTLTERWVLSRHQACLEEADAAFDAYRFDEASQTLHRFFWSELCDWGLEAEKRRRATGTDAERHRASEVLAWVLERTLRLLHPLMPFVTEEVWQRFGAERSAAGVGSIVVAPWPEPHPEHRDADAEEEFDFVRDLVAAVRGIRGIIGAGEYQLVVGDRLELELEPVREAVERLAGAELIGLRYADYRGGFVRLSVRGREARLKIPLGFDPAAAIALRRKRLDDTRSKMEGSGRKLENEAFLSRAAPEAVEKEHRKFNELSAEVAVLEDQISLLESLGG